MANPHELVKYSPQIKNLELKIKFLREYLDNGGLKKIPDPLLIQDIIDIKNESDGNIDSKTITPKLNAFMGALLASNLIPPAYSPEHSSEYQSLIQKNLFFDQITIDTKEEFDRFYDENKASNNILFRGQSEAKWRLYSKLQRFWINDRLFAQQDGYQSLLEKMVDIGRKDYIEEIGKILDKNNIDTTNDIAVLGYLQHHGCPTPLLDWSFRIGNSLYFALDGIRETEGSREIDNYFSIYYLEEEHFESGGERTMLNEILPEINEITLNRVIDAITRDPERREKMKQHFKGREILDRKQFNGSGFMSHMTKIKHMINISLTYFSDKDVESGIIFSLNNSNNILNQEGVFTWVSHPSKPLEMVAEEDYFQANPEKEKNDYRFCNCLNVNKNLKEHILKRITDDGITKEYIYSDDNISTWSVYEQLKKI